MGPLTEGYETAWIEGRFEENVITTTRRAGHQLGPPVEHVADDVRPGLLRHRDDGGRRPAVRHRPLRRRRLSATPRQADLMIVAGTVTYKMASRVRRLYNQMPDPKFVIAMGACTCGGGPYFKYGLQRRQGRGPGRAGRRVRARLPAAAGGAAGRADADPGQDPRPQDHQAGGREDRRRAAGAAPQRLRRRGRTGAGIRPPEDHGLGEGLDPKLRLGTQVTKLCFESSKRTSPDWLPSGAWEPGNRISIPESK